MSDENKSGFSFGVVGLFFLGVMILVGIFFHRSSKTNENVSYDRITSADVKSRIIRELPTGSSWAKVEKFLNENGAQHSGLIPNPSKKVSSYIVKKGKRVQTWVNANGGSTAYGMIHEAGQRNTTEIHIALEFKFDRNNTLASYAVQNTYSEVK